MSRVEVAAGSGSGSSEPSDSQVSPQQTTNDGHRDREVWVPNSKRHVPTGADCKVGVGRVESSHGLSSYSEVTASNGNGFPAALGHGFLDGGAIVDDHGSTHATRGAPSKMREFRVGQKAVHGRLKSSGCTFDNVLCWPSTET